MSIRLPALEQDIKVSTASLTKAIAAANKFSRDMQKSLDIDTGRFHQKMDSIQSKTESVGRSARDAGNGFSSFNRALGSLAKRVGEVSAALSAINRETDKFAKSADSAAISSEEAAKGVDDLGDKALRAAPKVAAASREVDKLGKNARQAAGGVSVLALAMQGLDRATSPKLVSSITGVVTKVGLIGGVAGVAGAGVSQLGLGLTGLVGAIAPAATLLATFPSMLAGVGAAIITAKLALASDSTGKGDNLKAGDLDKSRKALSDQLKQVQTAVQKETTPSFVKLFDTIGAKAPVAAKAFGSIGAELSHVIDGLTGLVGSKSFLNDFTTLMQSAGRQTKTYGGALIDVLKGFTDMSTTGIPVVEEFSQKVAQLATRFKDFSKSGSDDGSFAAMFERGYEVAGKLVRIVKDLGLGLAGLASAANAKGVGDGFLGALQRGMTGLRDFASNYSGQLQAVYGNANKLITSLGPLISQLGRTIFLSLGSINIAPLIDGLTTFIRSVGPALVPLGNSFVTFGSKVLGSFSGLTRPLQTIASNIGDVVESFGDIVATAIPNLVGPLKNITGTLAKFVTDMGRVFNDVLPSLGKPLETVVSSSETMITKLAQALAPFIKDFSQPIADMFAKIQTAVGDTATSISGPLHNAVGDVLPAAQGAFDKLLPAVSGLVKAAADLVAAFGTSFGGAITGAVNVVTPMIKMFTDVVTAVGKLPGPLKDVITGFLAFNTLKKINLFSNLIGPTSSGKDVLKKIMDDAKSSVNSFNTGVATKIGGAGVAGKFSGLTGTIGKVGAAASGLVKGALTGLVGFMGGPVGIALAGVTLAMTLFGSKNEEVEAREKAHAEELGRLKGAVDQITGSFNAAAKVDLAKTINTGGFESIMARVGVTTAELVSAVSKGGESLDTFKTKAATAFSAYATEQLKLTANSGAYSEVTQFLSELGLSMDDLVKAWAGGTESYNAFVQDVANKTGKSTGDISGFFENVSSAIDRVTDGSATKFRGLGDQVGIAAEAAKQARDDFVNLANAAYDSASKLAGFNTKVGKGGLVDALTDAANKGKDVREVLNGLGITGAAQEQIIASLGDKYDETSGKLTGMGTEAQKAYDAMLAASKKALDATPNATKLADAFKQIGDNANDAATKVSALTTILDILAGGTQSVQQAQSKWYDAMDNVKRQVESLTKDNNGLVAAINKQHGAINVQNADQRKFLSSLDGTTEAYAAAIQATYDSVKAHKGEGAALDAVREKAVTQREAFVKMLEQMGFVPEAANRIATELGLIPENVVTAYSLKGFDEVTINRVSTLVAKLHEIPGRKSITVDKSQVTDTTQKALEKMGYTVTHLPNGKVTITDTSAEVQKNLETIQKRIKDSPKGKVEIDSKTATDATLKRLKDVGLTVKKLPNGKFEITDNKAAVLKNVAAIEAAVKKEKKGTITIDSKTTSDDALTRLKNLGYTVQRLPNGKITISDNTGTTKTNLQAVMTKLGQVPTGKSITMKALTADAVQALRDMGYTVTQNAKNKTFTITASANVGSAEAAIAYLARDRTFNLYPTVQGAAHSGSGYSTGIAAGGLFHGGVQAYAAGGVRGIPSHIQLADQLSRARPMSAARAQVVPPNTPRLIGDNTKFPELFAPLNPYDPRAINLMKMGMRIMGLDKEVRPRAAGGIDTTAGTIKYDFYDPSSSYSLVTQNKAITALAAQVKASFTTTTSAINSARDNINAHVNSARDSIRASLAYQNSVETQHYGQIRARQEAIWQATQAALHKNAQGINVIMHNPSAVPALNQLNAAMQKIAAAVLTRK